MRPPQATVATGGSVRLEDSEVRQLLSDLDDGTVYYLQGDGLLEETITAMTNVKHDTNHGDDKAVSISYGDTRNAKERSWHSQDKQQHQDHLQMPYAKYGTGLQIHECDKEWGVKQVDSDVILGIKCIAKEDKIIGERLHNWDTNSLTY